MYIGLYISYIYIYIPFIYKLTYIIKPFDGTTEILFSTGYLCAHPVYRGNMFCTYVQTNTGPDVYRPWIGAPHLIARVPLFV